MGATSIEEMISIVQIYIKQRKDVDVNIKIRDLKDISKLTIAYNIAIAWLNNNNAVITKI